MKKETLVLALSIIIVLLLIVPLNSLDNLIIHSCKIKTPYVSPSYYIECPSLVAYRHRPFSISYYEKNQQKELEFHLWRGWNPLFHFKLEYPTAKIQVFLKENSQLHLLVIEKNQIEYKHAPNNH